FVILMYYVFPCDYYSPTDGRISSEDKSEQFNTFKESAAARGLLDATVNWEEYFEEAASFQMPYMMRQLFVTVIAHEKMVQVSDIWEKFKEDMMEDYMFLHKNTERAENLAKNDIENQLKMCGRSLADFGISLPNKIALDDQSWDKEKELKHYEEMHAKMNENQKKIVKQVRKKIEDKKSRKLRNGCVCIDGPGGSGKTYTYQTLCHLFRGEDIKYKTSSWMGIAANLLPDGRTMHRTFGLPFGEIDHESSSNAKPNSKLGEELKETDVFIIDEVSMVSKHVLRIIDKKLQEIMENKLPFGGKILIIGGDFRQILPIKKHAGRSQLVSLSVKTSYLWKYFKTNIFRLTENKRASKNGD
ncbi:AAA family ATPase, partial [Arachidicoccus sp.]|uniref:AAA family ATPase n=1 Tax=Arachidicoccus sp. TaxID=1872624 RepID=UPI003D1C6A47